MNWYCVSCTTAYSVGAPSCPHCGSTEYVEEPMAKISVHGGPTTLDDIGAEQADEVQLEVADEPEPVEAPDVPVAPGVPYDTWLLTDLQDELSARALPKSGNKPELVQRLIDDDGSQADAAAQDA